jgi:hypothetical protein
MRGQKSSTAQPLARPKGIPDEYLRNRYEDFRGLCNPKGEIAKDLHIILPLFHRHGLPFLAAPSPCCASGLSIAYHPTPAGLSPPTKQNSQHTRGMVCPFPSPPPYSLDHRRPSQPRLKHPRLPPRSHHTPAMRLGRRLHSWYSPPIAASPDHSRHSSLRFTPKAIRLHMPTRWTMHDNSPPNHPKEVRRSRPDSVPLPYRRRKSTHNQPNTSTPLARPSCATPRTIMQPQRGSPHKHLCAHDPRPSPRRLHRFPPLRFTPDSAACTYVSS